MSGRMDFSFGFSTSQRRPRDPEQPLRILVLSDLSGSSERGELAVRKPLRIDVDNLDARFGALFPSAHLSDELVLSFESPDELHPDQLFQNAELFRSFRELRARLADPATFADAAAELGGGSTEERAKAQTQAVSEFDRLLGGEASSSAAGRVGGSQAPKAIDDLIRGIVAPHVQAAPDPTQPLMVAAADHAISDTMRAVLGHPAVRRLETAWLGLSRLVRNLGSEEDIQIFVLDVSFSELNEALRSGDSRASDLHAVAVAPQNVPGTTPWSLWVADFTFGNSAEDLHILGAIGSLAAEAGAPLLSDAAPALLGISAFGESPDPAKWPGSTGELAEAWRTLRASEVASWIGLTAPRILLRLPYGAQTDPAERIRFEEMPAPGIGSYVWGSSALALAQLVAKEFSQEGWEFSAPDGRDIEDLPVHIYREGNETIARATAEAYLPEHAADALLRAGIIPILSIRGRDAARVVRVRSIADPSLPLKDLWN